MFHRFTRNLSGCRQWARVARSRARFALLGPALTAIAVVSLAAPATSAAAPPTLQGETFSESETYTITPPACDSYTDNYPGSYGSFCVTGTATGPYPGQYTEQGSYTGISAYDYGQGYDYGALTAYTVTFTISSPQGTVTGSESLRTGTYNVSGVGPPQFYDEINANTNYTATITRPDGTAYSDSGTTGAYYQFWGSNYNGPFVTYFTPQDSFSSSNVAVNTISPVPELLPTIAGTPEQGDLLTETKGAWSNSPTSFRWQWQVCNPEGNTCQNIPDATGQKYTLTSNDVGNTVRVQEWATNQYGTGGPSSSIVTPLIQAPNTPPPPPPPPPPPSLTLSNLTATVNGSLVNVSVHTSPAIVNVTLEEKGSKIAPDDTPVNGVASWTVTLPPGTHTLAVQGWNSPSGTPGQHSGILATTVVIASSPPPPPPPPPPPTPPSPPSTSSPPQSVVITTSPVTVVIVNVANVKARLIQHLVPSGTRRAGLLKNGRYTYSFNMPSAGRLVINWYRANTHALVASGHAAFSKAGLVKVTMKLTATGRRMLKATRSLKLTAKATYTSADRPAVVVTKRFTVRR